MKKTDRLKSANTQEQIQTNLGGTIMGYHDDIRKKIMSEGMSKTPAYAKQKAEEYQKSAATNYLLYKRASSKKEAQSRYTDSQNAYAKAAAWKEVLALLLRKLSNR